MQIISDFSGSHLGKYVLHKGVNLRLFVMVPLSTSIGGIARYVGDDMKVHVCTHQKRVIIKRNMTGQK